MTLNGVMAVTLRYFTEFGKDAFHFQHITSSIYIAEYMPESIVFCSASCTMSSVKKFTFAISSPDKFLVKPPTSVHGLSVNGFVKPVKSHLLSIM